MPRERRGQPVDDRLRVEHMLEAARDALSFMRGRSREDLETDSVLLRALTNAVQEIGEAAARLSDDGRARVPGIPWGKMVAMRHVLVEFGELIDRQAHLHTTRMIPPAWRERICRQANVQYDAA